MLTLNAIWKGWYHPPNCRKIRKKKTGKSNQHDFLQVLSKLSWTTFKMIFETLSTLGACQVTIIGGLFTQNLQFSRFFENISASVSFFMKSFLVTRSCQFLAVYMIMFDPECASYHGDETQKPKFWAFLNDFDNFGHFSGYLI